MRAVIFDVDGTLCDVQGVRHYVEGDIGNRNFTKFHNASLFCPPHKPVVALTHSLRDDVARLVVTARGEQFRHVTKMWLDKHQVNYHRLFMRPWGDMRPDYEVKTDILNEIRDEGFTVVHAIDDNPSVVELWQEHGIGVTVVPGWPE